MTPEKSYVTAVEGSFVGALDMTIALVVVAALTPKPVMPVWPAIVALETSRPAAVVHGVLIKGVFVQYSNSIEPISSVDAVLKEKM